MSNYKVIGTRPIRPDGADKVTGRAVYGADVQLPGLLHGKVLRSPHAHARITSLDTSAAEKYPGVKAVATNADLPNLADHVAHLGESSANMRYMSQNILARNKVLYHGHAIAAVAAENPHVAEEALKLIKVEYELLTPVLDEQEAMKPGAPIVLEDLRTSEFGNKLEGPTNIASHLRHQRGDVEQGFAEADIIVEREFHTGTVHQGYIEPQNGTALWSQDGSIQVWCSTQGTFTVRQQLAELLQVPISSVTVTPTEIGGGFGGKTLVYLEPIAAILSKKSGNRPVKMTMTRAEVLQATGPTSASYMKVKIGAKKNGKITAAQAYLAYEAGAYPGSPVGAGSSVIFGPYKLDNLLIDGYDVIVNKCKAAAYRAPGGTNAAFASETVVDELAEKLGIDPVEMRVINGVKEGDRRSDGPVFKSIGYLECLEATRNHPHYSAPLPKPSAPHCKVGRGVAGGFWFNWGGRSSASVSVNPDGTVNLLEGSPDIGGSRASMAIMLAETLGINYEAVKPQVVGTDRVGYNDTTGGSRVTAGTGLAVHTLGKKLLAEMAVRAADMWEVKPEDVKVENGVFSHNGHSMTFKELAAKSTDVPLAASASTHAEEFGNAFGVHIVDVEVDTETGKTQILRYTAVQDVGRAIHPSYVEGQMHGGVAQGVGWALNEEYVYNKDGRLLNSSLLDYRMPTALDLPMIDTVMVEVPFPAHPFGVRGVGEVPIVPPAAAVANAIHQALGVRMEVLPMSPPNVMETIWKNQ